MTDLDSLVARARTATVKTDVAEAYVRELDRWARPAPPRRAWFPWLAAGVAVAAAIVLVVVRAPAGPQPAQPIGVGDRVSIVVDPGTLYRVIEATAGETRIAVDRGTVTAQLAAGDAPHTLLLEGGGVVASATAGTCSLAVGPDGGVVHVHEGTVSVASRDGVRSIAAGATFPANAPDDPRSTERLALADAGTEHARSPIDAGVRPDAAVSHRAPPDVRVEPSPPGDAEVRVEPDAAADLIKDRWRRARLLRAQGNFKDAVAECEAIAGSRDATWAPIALVEEVRIYLGPLADPERAIAVAERMLRDWPADALAAEARELRCRALRQLGREC